MSTATRLLAGGAAVVLVAMIVVGVLVFRGSADAAGPLKGSRVSDADLRILVSAAASCPVLTPARLAGQVMVASNFGDQPVAAMNAEGAAGIAALTPQVWQKWAPWPGAGVTDRAAAITALAHDMCQLAGQARAVRLPGDPWQVALAAYRGGMDAVVAAGGIPAGVRDYVDTVGRYASWYALQPEFGGDGQTALTPAASTVGTAVVRVPDQYLKAVVAAGNVCPEMPPARIAAQIMATSGFDPQKLGPTGEQGIAQFRPQTWLAYAPSAASRTPWDPATAIPALGKTMCALVKQASGAYGTALAAFAGGGSREPVTALAGAVAKNQAEYAKDTRLRATPAPSTSKPRPHASSTGPSSGATATPTPSVRANQPPVKAAGNSSYGPFFIYNFATKECVDLPNFGVTKASDPVTQFPCAKTGTDNQEFAFVPRTIDSAGNQLYWIKNTDSGFCVDPPGAGTVGSGTVLSEITCLDNDNQYFRLELRFASGGFEYYWLRNSVAGDMCLDVPGKAVAGPDARLALVPCLEHDDHEWALVEKQEW